LLIVFFEKRNGEGPQNSGGPPVKHNKGDLTKKNPSRTLEVFSSRGEVNKVKNQEGERGHPTRCCPLPMVKKGRIEGVPSKNIGRSWTPRKNSRGGES